MVVPHQVDTETEVSRQRLNPSTFQWEASRERAPPLPPRILSIGANTPPCTPRRTCCPMHCASYCAPCQPRLRERSRQVGETKQTETGGGMGRTRARMDCQTMPKLTLWICGTNSSTASERRRNNSKRFEDLTWKPRPEYGPDCLMCAIFARLRFGAKNGTLFFFFFNLVTGPRRSWSPKLSDTRVYAPQIRARLGTTAHF